MVTTNDWTTALTKAKQDTASIKFPQRVEIIVTLKDIDLKKPEQQVDFFLTLPHSIGKDVKICGLVGPELVDESKKHLDYTIQQSDFDQTAANKANVKKLASQYTFFVAQANVMPKVAQSFGRVLGPRGKMPNPKAGCVVPPKAALAPLKEKLSKTVRVTAKTAPNIQVAVGSMNMQDEHIIENIEEVFKNIVSHLPQGDNNVRRVLLKTTMSPPQRVA